MYLKRLEMLGFKSFATRTLLEFSPGITAVVGPNGAGKSNVADSMRWVLGEQSMRQLRGKKSDDIIFIGGQSRAPLGMAEVSLTLDNSTGWVPSEYGEITVTRRSYRSGENEYLINKQKVRLKDVLLLLAQARIGHDSYTVVGQGLIDAALSLRAEERRALFEDAAGIRPFQVQRTDAELRLRQTEQNVERLRDIVNEIEPRLAPLKEQSQRAIEYEQRNQELQDVLVSWYLLQWRRLRTTRDRTAEIEHEQAQRVRQGEQELQVLNERVQELRTQRQQIQSRIRDARQASIEVSATVQQYERELAVNEERVTNLEQQQEELQREERRQRERLITLQKQTIDLEEQCDLADEALDNGSAKLAKMESEVTSAQKEYTLDEHRLRGSQNDLAQVQARLSSARNEVGRQQKQLRERNQSLIARRETIAQSQQKLTTYETRIHEGRALLETVRNEEQQLIQRKQSIAQLIAESAQELERMKSTLAEAERRKRTTVDRLNMLNNWRQSLSGYSDGVRAILRAPADKISGLIGPVPQLGVVPEGLEQALEAALGSYMQAVVVATLADAAQSMTYLQQSNAGKAMVIWLERSDEDEESSEVRELQEQEEEMVLTRYLETLPDVREASIGFAWKFVTCEKQYIELFRRLLQGIVLTRTTEAAYELLRWALHLSVSSGTDLPFTKVVTLGGEVLHVDGWLIGGSGKVGKDGAAQGLLAHERELRELPQHLNDINGIIEQIHTLMSEAQRKQEARRSEQSGVEKELHKVTARSNEHQKNVNTLQRDLERVQTEIRLAASVEQQLAQEVAALEREVVTMLEQVSAHEKSQRELAGLVDELQFEMEERATSYRRLQDELGRARTAFAVKRQEAKSLRLQLSQQQTQSQDLKNQVQQQVVRLQEAVQRRQALVETIAQQRTQLAQVQQQAQQHVAHLQSVEAQSGETDQQVAALEQRRTILQHGSREQEASYRRSLLDSQKARDAVETLLTQLQEDLGISSPEELAKHEQHLAIDDEPSEQQDPAEAIVAIEADLSSEEETQLRKYRRRVEALRSRLKSIGGYDSNAPQLYEETRTRYEFLTSQIEDLTQAASQLHTIIDQLDGTMAKQFETTFQAVNARFREHFTTLFNGGTARLELITARNADDEEDANGTTSATRASGMPGGVDVIVQPPGKKVQDLSLLSGGERALVSAALLFALLEINPPPFCLLDEVDAALDESNVTRFCDILKKLSQRTQFIVITHNRVTMTAAQAIYGVSMRDSISRLLSLRLDEVPVSSVR